MQHELQAGLLAQVPVPVHHAPRRIGVVQRTGYLPAQTAARMLEALRKVAADIDIKQNA